MSTFWGTVVHKDPPTLRLCSGIPNNRGYGGGGDRRMCTACEDRYTPRQVALIVWARLVIYCRTLFPGRLSSLSVHSRRVGGKAAKPV